LSIFLSGIKDGMSNTPKSQLKDFLDDIRCVNCYKDMMLDQEYYVSQGKMYKKLTCGYRPLKEQENFCHYKHYLVNDTNHKRKTVNVKSLDKLTYINKPTADRPESPKISLLDNPDMFDVVDDVLLTPD
jgi:hypothetical protein